MSLILETPETRAPERDYILGVVLGEFLGLDWRRVPTDRADTRITLQGHKGEIRLPDILLKTLDEDWLAPQSLPVQPLQHWDIRELGMPINVLADRLPIIYGKLVRPVIASKQDISLPLDIFGSAFFMLTRYEELLKKERDDHDRFPATASLAYQENFLLRPIVDEYVEVLWAAMQWLWPGIERKRHWPRMVPTHDVDRPFGAKGERFSRVLRHCCGDVIKRKSLVLAMRRLLSHSLPGLKGYHLDPNNTFDWIMDQSERYGLRSEFYFMAGKTSKYDSGYDVFSPRIQGLLKKISTRGHFVGIHPSYGTLGEPDLLNKEVEKLKLALAKADVRQELTSGRQHYLRWQAESTWDDWEQAGLEFDSSVCFAQHIGFRSGTCRRYRVWSWRESRMLNLVERPLLVMEGSLLADKYMGVQKDNCRQLLADLSDSVKLMRGEMTILWHNDAFLDQCAAIAYAGLLEGFMEFDN